MPSRLLLIAAFAGTVVLSPVAARAQMLVPVAPYVTMDEAREIAMEQQIIQIDRIELNENTGRWFVEGVDANDRDVDMEIDARTGSIIELDR